MTQPHPFKGWRPFGRFAFWRNLDERVVKVRPERIRLPTPPYESPLSVLMRASRATTVDEIGTYPPLASISNKGTTSLELKRYEHLFTPDALLAARAIRSLYPQVLETTVLFVAPFVSIDGSEGPGATPGTYPHHFYPPDEKGEVKPPAYRRTDGNLLAIISSAEVLKGKPEYVTQQLRYPKGLPRYEHKPEWREGELVWRDGEPYTLAKSMLDGGKWLLNELARYPGAGQSLIWMDRANTLGNSYTTLPDSPNNFHHKDARLMDPPVASLWINALAVDSLEALADQVEAHKEMRDYVRDDIRFEPARLRAQANATRHAVLDAMTYMDSDGKRQFSHAADGVRSGVLQQSEVTTAEIGMILNTGLLRGNDPDIVELRENCIRKLFSPEMLSPFGIRGRASDEARSFEFDYHAQVWAVMTFECAMGMLNEHPRLAYELFARIMRQTGDGLFPEFTGAGTEPTLRYCPYELKVRMPLAGGGETDTVAERTPQENQTWTFCPVMFIDALSRILGKLPPMTALEKEILGRLTDRAFESALDLRWTDHGSRSLDRAQAMAATATRDGVAEGPTTVRR